MASRREEAERRRLQAVRDLSFLTAPLLPRRPALEGAQTTLYERPSDAGEAALRPATEPRYAADAAWAGRSSQARESDAEARRNLEKSLASSTRAVLDLAGGLTGNTRALRDNTAGLVSSIKALAGGLSGGFSGLSGVSGILKAATGLLPVAGFVAGLFKRNKKPEPTTFTGSVAPSPLQLSVTNTDNILRGFPRAVRGYADEVRPAPVASRVAAVANRAAPQVTVNISAMDSKSFLDRSGDIAQAMRDAMLHSHPVNDVIGEL